MRRRSAGPQARQGRERFGGAASDGLFAVAEPGRMAVSGSVLLAIVSWLHWVACDTGEVVAVGLPVMELT